MNKWQVSTNYVCGRYFYEVYRLKDPNAVDNSGNRETMGSYPTKKLAQAVADMLNKDGEDDGR